MAKVVKEKGAEGNGEKRRLDGSCRYAACVMVTICLFLLLLALCYLVFILLGKFAFWTGTITGRIAVLKVAEMR
ncbi:hypothetical protein MRX96_000602 [Rhipicephalus microplus]